jgi:hypothetical protein
MYSKEIEIIADTLCNIFDWDSSDLKSDFINALKQNNIQLKNEIAEKIFDDFMTLDAVTRSSPDFNYQEFISSHYIS